ncbi:TonB-dependent receptor-like protein [Albidovulum inexpectatum]|uniref:TonB-dependent receptor-like protein n=1 Tax=Albidovulum inexpectatum TaxID=196587 RepID=A0A2S5JH50_9RHOB|nr:TonB-dependent receptor [Albidovulum inexpectatum]PPB80834.1 TonB-dependent receptor-like protein [Albidovulum inexpectatum]
MAADWQPRADIRVTGRLRHSGSYYSDDENTAAAFIPSYTVAAARVSWTPREGMELFAYVNNILDEDAVTYMRYSRTIAGYEATVLAPREVGLGMKLTF